MASVPVEPSQRTLTTFAVFVAALPQQVLSSNAGKNSRRDPWSVANAVGELKDEVVQTLLSLGVLPRFETAVVTVTQRVANRRLKLEDCFRCLNRFLAGDHPKWAEDRCACYRPKDVGNVIHKGVLDALVFMELIEDDDFTHIPELRLRLERVTEIADEGIYVEMEGE